MNLKLKSDSTLQIGAVSQPSRAHLKVGRIQNGNCLQLF